MQKEYEERIGRVYPLKALPGRQASFKASGMDFTASAFEAEGLGHVSVMEAEGMGGMMKMISMIINPFEKDAPILSCDRIYAMGTVTEMVEMFDSMLAPGFDAAPLEKVRERYADLPDVPAAPSWYDGLRIARPMMKKTGEDKKERLEQSALEYLEVYLSACEKAPACRKDEKMKKAAVYSEGLLQHGGPATDPVKAAIGEEKTKDLFRRVLFGTEA